MTKPLYFAGIEAGGTKTFVAVGDEKGNVLERVRIATTTPQETMPKIITALKELHQDYPFNKVGVAAFGPLDPVKTSSSYGWITSTPKVAWKNFDYIGSLRSCFKDWQFAFDTDVNGAALAEYLWGNTNNVSNLVYLTVGTGIGGGIVNKGELIHGALHPELGHFHLPRHPHDQTYSGCCPYHGDCLEGLASGTALTNRWNVVGASDLPVDHIAWEIEAHYLAHALVTYLCCFAPEKIILGGGVMHQQHLLARVRTKVRELLNSYLSYPAIQSMESLILPASFGDNTGVKGALALAHSI